MSTTTIQTISQQPDIEYAPNINKWKARTESRLANEKLRSDLPPGYPKKLESDLVWEGESLKEKYNWVYELNQDELDEIERGLVHFKSMYHIS